MVVVRPYRVEVIPLREAQEKKGVYKMKIWN